MLEYALYGVTKKKFGWKGENFKRLEKTYSRGGRWITLHTRLCQGAVSALLSRDSSGGSGSVPGCPKGCGCEHVLISRGQPDPNRHRTSVVTRVRKARLVGNQSPDDYLARLGYAEYRSHLLDVDLYHRCECALELTQTLADFSKRPVNDNEWEKYEGYLLVKAYVEDKEPEVSENMLNSVCLELEDDVSLIKPSLDQF